MASRPLQGQHLAFADALARVPDVQGRRFAELFRHGSLSIEIYSPRGADLQQPHDRDEVYVVARGRGTFVFGDQRVVFGTGDFLFVPAGMAHRFESFTDELVVWVIFHGPPGGEAPAA